MCVCVLIYIIRSSLCIHLLLDPSVVSSPPSLLFWRHRVVDTASVKSSEDWASSPGSALTWCVIWVCHLIFRSLSFLICDVGIVTAALFFLEGCCKNPVLDYGNTGVYYRVCVLKHLCVYSQFLVPQSPSLLTE